MDYWSDTENLRNLKCCMCHNYLSYFPIYTDSDQTSICGRCQPVVGQSVYRNEIYELATEVFTFPCRNYSKGCLEKLIPKNIPEHEDLCDFRIVQCPIRDDHLSDSPCNWEDIVSDIYQHFRTQHPNLIPPDGKFEVDLTNNFSGKYLYSLGQDYFILTFTSNTDMNLLICNVVNIGFTRKVECCNFKITLKNESGAKKIEVCGNIEETFQWNTREIEKELDNLCSIIAEVEVYMKEEVKEDIDTANGNSPMVNYGLIEGMKCMVRKVILYTGRLVIRCIPLDM